jgi:hypothetical protein
MNQLAIYIWIKSESREVRKKDRRTFRLPDFPTFCGKFPYEKIQPHIFHIYGHFIGPGTVTGHAR